MIKALGAKLYAAWSHLKNEKWIKTPLETQEKVLVELLKQGAQTRFGKDHNFEKIRDLKTYQKEVPVRDYEGFKPYIDAILEGEKDVLWKGLFYRANFRRFFIASFCVPAGQIQSLDKRQG